MTTRIKFTTHLEPENIEWIKIEAIKRKCSPADILNELINQAKASSK